MTTGGDLYLPSSKLVLFTILIRQTPFTSGTTLGWLKDSALWWCNFEIVVLIVYCLHNPVLLIHISKSFVDKEMWNRDWKFWINFNWLACCEAAPEVCKLVDQAYHLVLDGCQLKDIKSEIYQVGKSKRHLDLNLLVENIYNVYS